MNQYVIRFWTSLLTMSLLLSLAACGDNDTAATTMRLKHTEGTVAVSDGDGKDIPLLDNLGLYSGYEVSTRLESYAWINLDDVKLTKMDQESEIDIQKEGKSLEIEVKSGSLFFNVTQPLEDDETLDIRTSTMLIGIRGTCGWVEERDGISRVYLLEGTVECSGGGQTVQINAGEMAKFAADGKLVVEPFTVQDVPVFVRDDLDADLINSMNELHESDGPDNSETADGQSGQGEDAETFSDPEGDVTWAFEGASRGNVLTVSGTGRMPDYDGDIEPPWWPYQSVMHTVIIGDGVTSIGNNAFVRCDMTDLIIPDSVISIGDWAFFTCTGLTSVTIPDSVISIGNHAFENCSGLTSVTIPDSVTSIGESAFRNCSSLTSVTIPDSVISIGNSAFSDCGNLVSVTIPGSITSVGTWIFSYCDSLTEVYYGGSESQWEQFVNEIENYKLLNVTVHYNSKGN